MKQKIYNLIILDESGSMDCVTKQTISGSNETINTIKSAEKKYGEIQEHFISIYAFQSNENVKSRYIIKNMPAENANHITGKDYSPWGGTPLNDAVGSTLIDLMAKTAKYDNSIGSVTIITDGMENSSTEFTTGQIAEMIKSLKKKGWNFNFIGANIDVEGTAKVYNIDNYLEFEQNSEETAQMFSIANSSRMAYYKRMSTASPCMCKEDFVKHCEDASMNFFIEE